MIYTAGIGVPITTGGLIKGNKELIKGLRTGASKVVREGGEYVIRKAVVSKLDEIRNIAKIMDDFPNLRALGNNAESLAEKLLKASDGDTQILSRLNSLPDKTIETFVKDFSQADDILAKFAKDPDLIKAWERALELGDNVIPVALRNNTTFLTKYDDLIKNNKLGLDAQGLDDLLKLPSTKIDKATGLPLKWDDPEAVLDAVRRASDSNIAGLKVTHKKFPAPADGTNNFVSKNAKQYQAEASLDAGLSFEKGGVSFDDIATDGKLVDRKYGHGKSVFDNDGGVVNENRAQSILEQAQRQLNAVGGDGAKLRWEISTSEGASGIRSLFINNGIDIEVVHKVQKTIITN